MSRERIYVKMKKEDFFWPVIIGGILAMILDEFINFQFFLKNPEYRWMIPVICIITIILCAASWYLIRKNKK